MGRRGVNFSKHNKIKEREQSNKWDPIGSFLKGTLLWGIKILRIFLIVGHPRDPKGEDHGYLTTFRGINAPKSGPFKYENNAQTLPKQLQNNFEKVQKSTFLTPKMVKMTPQIGQNEQNFDPKTQFSRSFIDL